MRFASVAWVVCCVVLGCDRDEPEVSVEVAAEVSVETAVEVETVAEVSVEVETEVEVAIEVETSPEVAEEVSAVVMPGVTEPIVFTPEAASVGVRVQPTVAWDVGSDGVGRLAMGWAGQTDDDLGIVLGVWDVDGRGAHEVHGPIVINEDRTGIRNEPSICALAEGGFVIVWSIDTQVSPDNLRVAWRRVDREGVPIDAREVVVQTARTGNHWLAKVACTADGGFTIAGVRSGAEGSGFAAFTKHYDRSGAPGVEADVFVRATGGQLFPVVAEVGSSTWVAWEDSPTATDDTVIALRTGEGERYVVVSAAGKDAQSPLIAGRDGALLVGGLVNGRLKVALGDGVVAPTGLALPDTGATGAGAAAVRGDGFGLVWLRGSGANVEVRYAPIDKGAFGTPVTLDRGSFPLAYRPAVAMAPGFGAVAWTESLGSGKYGVNVALFAP